MSRLIINAETGSVEVRIGGAKICTADSGCHRVKWRY